MNQRTPPPPEETPDAPTFSGGRRIHDLIERLRESTDKLATDETTTRGDLKILSRTLRELRYAFKVFAPYRRARKVSVFGSARTPADHPEFQQAVAFGRAMADQQWLVVTGAAGGIMEAGHRGAGRANAMGLNILLPFEQESNPVIAGDPKLVHMKYFFTRKLMFVKECDAIVCLPGGFGTLDEALEVLTLLQTGKREMAPVVLLDAPGGSYWRDFDQFVHRHLLDRGMISPEDLALYRVSDQCQEAVDEILAFFRKYHSMRYVRNQLVLRVSEPLSPEFLAEVNLHFRDLLTQGQIIQTGPLEGERDEPELNHLTRLVLDFNRRNHGRLRMLIDAVNSGTIAPWPPQPSPSSPPPRDA